MDHAPAAALRDAARLRDLVAEGVRQNPVVTVSDPALLTRLADPAADCGFEELGFDSLARMELCIWMQVEAGLEVTEAELLDHPTVAALAVHLAVRG
ncbi:acyl carrier protein [Roseomonas rosulenta]|uniref:acyl carrier protein n=1 Tax=Roseomonas rosulenta TaxID=2748667 RepID=UPI0018DEFAF4|nr:acyl carrier protein [Roseomonas rosulenta]